MVAPRYNFLERLAAGGMAEVYVAEQTNVEGFKKKVAIKRVLPHLSANESFIAMFLDEARLGARLQNANIVSVLDIGATETDTEGEKAYFIVMEYIDGCDLKKLIESSRKRNEAFPLKEAIYIAIEASGGLSHAHNLIDENGQPCNIVHRDISPPNILLSRDGEVKVTDFGLAKATTQISKTDPGMVKGKFSYLAPEAALGEAVDARADIFALGVVLWEMIAGRRLFYGDTDYHTVKLVQQANIPRLSHVRPADVDEELERILDRALAREPAKRYQSAAEFSKALTQYIFKRQLAVTQYDIAALVKRTLADESDQAKPPQSLIDQLIQEELGRFTSIEQEEEESQGSTPLGEVSAGAFENPADWFSDDDFGDGDAAPAPQQQAAPSPAPAQAPAPPAASPAAQAPAPPAQAAAQAQPAQAAQKAAPPAAHPAPAPEPAQAAAHAQPAQAAEAKEKGGSGLLVAGGVLLAAAAAAAYFILAGG